MDNLEDNTEALRIVAISNDQFSTKLYNIMKEEEGNLIMSPCSVSICVAMLSAGARGNTLQQIQSAFSFPPASDLHLGYKDIIPALRSSDDFITLETGNTIFASKDLSVLEDYQEVLSRSFHATIQTVEFGDNEEAAKIINSWVEKMTRDRIKNLVHEDMLSSRTSLVLVSTIYFKGDWKYKFDPELTGEKDFFVSPTITVKVLMMKKEKKFFWANLETLASTMVELPYNGDRMVMQVLLPDEKNGLAELEEKLMTHSAQELFDQLNFETKVELQLPKFKVEQSIDLEDPLMGLGVRDMFTYGEADFSGIDGNRDQFVNQVIHKAFIEVTEDGTEAAAATAALMKYGCSAHCPPPPPAKQFIVDHPFMFYLRDRTTGMLLFQGRVVNMDKRAV